MSPAIASSVSLVAYLALFAAVGIVFLFANLVVGRFLRPHNPHSEKLEIYECGEPTIGSGFVQFDLRFYVVALLFIIFDVEVAFFFPWAAVFGKSTNMMDRDLVVAERSVATSEVQLTPAAIGLYRELGVQQPAAPTTIPPSLADTVDPKLSAAAKSSGVIHEGARQLAWITIVDIAAFFTVLLIGFAYVWKRGDLDWVRAVSQERADAPARPHVDDLLEEEQALSV